jgi:hypothetical protein
MLCGNCSSDWRREVFEFGFDFCISPVGLHGGEQFLVFSFLFFILFLFSFLQTMRA